MSKKGFLLFKQLIPTNNHNYDYERFCIGEFLDFNFNKNKPIILKNMDEKEFTPEDIEVIKRFLEIHMEKKTVMDSYQKYRNLHEEILYNKFVDENNLKEKQTCLHTVFKVVSFHENLECAADTFNKTIKKDNAANLTFGNGFGNNQDYLTLGVIEIGKEFAFPTKYGFLHFGENQMKNYTSEKFIKSDIYDQEYNTGLYDMKEYIEYHKSITELRLENIKKSKESKEKIKQIQQKKLTEEEYILLQKKEVDIKTDAIVDELEKYYKSVKKDELDFVPEEQLKDIIVDKVKRRLYNIEEEKKDN